MMDREKLLRYTGNMSQLAGVRKIAFDEGRAAGVRAYEVKTGSGFNYTLLQDKCLDIFEVSYRGVGLNYLCKNGLVAPSYFYPVEDGFVSNMTGGLLFTGGLRNAGAGGKDDDGSWQVTHGKISMTPAEQLSVLSDWTDEGYVMEVSGKVKETALFGHNLALSRKIRSVYGSSELELTDVVENNGPEAQEFMLLYHMNLGYPRISPSTRIIVDSTFTPIGPDTAEFRAEQPTFSEPVDGAGEFCFYHDIKPDADGWCKVQVENPDIGIGVYFKFRKDTLPNLIQWKCMRSGEYVLGIEPSNSYIKGRKNERANGTLKSIGGFERITHKVIFGAYDL